MRRMSRGREHRYVEHMAMYRHYSNVRFLMVPIFITVTFGLAFEFGNLEHLHVVTPPDVVEMGRTFLPAFGVLVAGIFLFVETVLDSYLTKHRLAASRYDRTSQDAAAGCRAHHPGDQDDLPWQRHVLDHPLRHELLRLRGRLTRGGGRRRRGRPPAHRRVPGAVSPCRVPEVGATFVNALSDGAVEPLEHESTRHRVPRKHVR